MRKLSIHRTLARSLLPALAAWHLCARSQVFVFDANRAIPDGSGVGLADVRSISGVAAGSSLTVQLSFSGIGDGMLTGDMYATLSHEDILGSVDAFAVLLNRPGRRAEDDEGYKDNGLSITLTSDAQAPDIHDYRLTLTGSHSIPLATTLSEHLAWSADGRQIDPGLVLNTNPRTATLEGFGAMNLNAGRWTLFVADLLPGGQAQLDRWGLTFTPTPMPIPEPADFATVSGLAALALGLARRFRTLGRTKSPASLIPPASPRDGRSLLRP